MGKDCREALALEVAGANTGREGEVPVAVIGAAGTDSSSFGAGTGLVLAVEGVGGTYGKGRDKGATARPLGIAQKQLSERGGMAGAAAAAASGDRSCGGKAGLTCLADSWEVTSGNHSV